MSSGISGYNDKSNSVQINRENLNDFIADESGAYFGSKANTLERYGISAMDVSSSASELSGSFPDTCENMFRFSEDELNQPNDSTALSEGYFKTITKLIISEDPTNWEYALNQLDQAEKHSVFENFSGMRAELYQLVIQKFIENDTEKNDLLIKVAELYKKARDGGVFSDYPKLGEIVAEMIQNYEGDLKKKGFDL